VNIYLIQLSTLWLHSGLTSVTLTLPLYARAPDFPSQRNKQTSLPSLFSVLRILERNQLHVTSQNTVHTYSSSILVMFVVSKLRFISHVFRVHPGREDKEEATDKHSSSLNTDTKPQLHSNILRFHTPWAFQGALSQLSNVERLITILFEITEVQC
jgi:hypothetical protein